MLERLNCRRLTRTWNELLSRGSRAEDQRFKKLPREDDDDASKHQVACLSWLTSLLSEEDEEEEKEEEQVVRAHNHGPRSSSVTFQSFSFSLSLSLSSSSFPPLTFSLVAILPGLPKK